MEKPLEAISYKRKLNKICLGSLVKIQILQPIPIDSDLVGMEEHEKLVLL